MNNWVNTLTIYNSNLVAGGDFDSADGKPANYIAQWNGTSWTSLGSGVNDYVWGLIVYNGNLIIGGSFDSAGGKPANAIAEWNGASWTTLGAGMNIYGAVLTVTANAGELYVGGTFDSAGGKPADYVAEWCPSSCPAGIDEVTTTDNSSLYPNPNNGMFTIKCQYANPQSLVEIYNMLGEKVYVSALANNFPTFNINIVSQPNGIYFYRVITEEGIVAVSGKFIVDVE